MFNRISSNSHWSNWFKYLNTNPVCLNIWERLSVGTVPTDKKHPVGTVRTDEMRLVGTVPTNKMHPVGTVPTDKMHPVGTIIFSESIILSLNLDCIAKINDLL